MPVSISLEPTARTQRHSQVVGVARLSPEAELPLQLEVSPPGAAKAPKPHLRASRELPRGCLWGGSLEPARPL